MQDSHHQHSCQSSSAPGGPPTDNPSATPQQQPTPHVTTKWTRVAIRETGVLRQSGVPNWGHPLKSLSNHHSTIVLWVLRGALIRPPLQPMRVFPVWQSSISLNLFSVIEVLSIERRRGFHLSTHTMGAHPVNPHGTILQCCNEGFQGNLSSGSHDTERFPWLGRGIN